MNNQTYHHDENLYNKATAIVLKFNKVSGFLLQQNLQISFGRAGFLIFEMEKHRFISKPDRNGHRAIIANQ